MRYRVAVIWEKSVDAASHDIQLYLGFEFESS
jgi:hypothetical protein